VEVWVKLKDLKTAHLTGMNCNTSQQQLLTPTRRQSTSVQSLRQYAVRAIETKKAKKTRIKLPTANEKNMSAICSFALC